MTLNKQTADRIAQQQKYPIGGYAPGSYQCKCTTCNTMFMGNREAFQCEPCAIKDKEFYDSLTPEGQRRFDNRFKEIVKLFFENRDLQEQNQKLRIVIDALVELKAYKDKHGKDSFYESRQSLAWKQATEALKQTP